MRVRYLLWANRDSWGGPLGAQPGRQALVRDLFSRVPFDFVAETGTFLGVTTAFLASCSEAPVYSVEVEGVYHRRARRNLRQYPSVHLTRGDSRDFLRSLSERDVGKRGFFYLDAHWLEESPLVDEIRFISSHWTDSVMVVDDFQVPDDAGYGFDDFGPEQRLDRSILPDDALAGFSLFYPALPSSDEPVTARGCVLLASPRLRESVEASPHLRLAELIAPT